MGWNEPGGDRDPWGGSRNQGPPDLDEIFRNLRKQFHRLFGGKSGGPGGPGGGFGVAGVLVVLVVVLVAWLASGFYVVNEGSRGVVTRFGAYAGTVNAGPHWHLPYPMGAVQRVDVERTRTVEIGYHSTSPSTATSVPDEALMLTQDENIVNVQLAIQYRVNNAVEYAFNFRDPDQTLKQLAESALREMIGKNRMEDVLVGTTGKAKDAISRREQLAQNIKALIENTLQRYGRPVNPEAPGVTPVATGDLGPGIEVKRVLVQDIQPPEQVQEAFADAIKAREDAQRYINKAQAYRSKAIPQANAKAVEIDQQARAYKESRIQEANGDTARFLEVLAAYSKAPAVNRERMYLDAMQQVLSKSSKVVVDVPGANPLMYLPLDKLGLGRGNQDRTAVPPSGAAGAADHASSQEAR